MKWSLAEVAIACGLIFALHALLLVPARKRLAAAEDASKPKWAGLVLVLETSQLIFLAALISAGLTWFILWLVTRGSGASAAAVAEAIERIQGIEKFIGKIKLELWLVAFVLAAFGLFRWIARSRRTKLAQARASLMQDKFNRLVEEFKRGELPPLEATADMLAAMQRVHTLDAQMQESNEKLAKATDESEKNSIIGALSGLESERRAAIDQLITLDLLRRVEVPPHDPDLVGLPPPARSLGQKVERVLVSRGLFRHLSVGQKLLLVINVLLVIPSLLTLTSSSLAANLEARITQLDQLRVNLTAQEAQQRFDAAARVAPPAPAQEIDEQTLTDIAYHHARAFEGAIARNISTQVIREISAPARDARAVLREHEARRRILDTVAERANTAPASAAGRREAVVRGLVTNPKIEHGPVDGVVQRAAVLAANPGRIAETAAGEALARDIIARGKAEPGFRERIAKPFRDAGAAYFEAARPSQLRSVLLASAFGGSAETAALAHAATEPVTKWAAASMQPGFEARAYQTYSRTYLATLLETGDAKAALKAVETMPNHHLLRTEMQTARSTIAPRIKPDADLVRDLQRFPPGLVEIHDGVSNTAARDAALKRFYEGEITRRGINMPAAERPARLAALVREAPAAANFERYFPSDHTASGGGGGGAGGPGGSRTTATNVGTRSTLVGDATRSRSFAKLRGYSRVGGVLIGQEPEGGSPTLDIRGIQWRQQGATLTLTLTDAHRKDITIGPVRTSLAYLALGYAADGRPLTVTMTRADPLRELRILLHPVLVDTAAGCRAIEIDRFVDEATSQSSRREEATARVQLQRSLYAVARAALVRAVFSGEDAKVLIERDEDAAGLVETVASGQTQELRVHRSALDAAMARPELLFDRRYSPLKVKSGYFHQRVVGLMETCARPNGSVPAFKQCVSSEAQKLAEAQRDLRSTSNLNWSAPTPTFEPWSGVRERAYKLDAGFGFAGVGRSNDPLPEPFDFLVQIAFTSPPYANQRKPWYEGPEKEDADDDDPWRFPDQDLKITESVIQLMQDSTKREYFAAMREFVWLQRLFRAGLAGGLGAQFPLERLAELAKSTAGAATRQRTLRWNVRPPEELALLRELATRLPTFSADGVRQAEACLRSIGIDPARIDTKNDAAVATAVFAARQRLYDVPDDRWDQLCRFSEAAIPRALAHASERASELRRLRASLGVRQDEKQVETGAKCGPL